MATLLNYYRRWNWDGATRWKVESPNFCAISIKDQLQCTLMKCKPIWHAVYSTWYNILIKIKDHFFWQKDCFIFLHHFLSKFFSEIASFNIPFHTHTQSELDYLSIIISIPILCFYICKNRNGMCIRAVTSLPYTEQK